MLIKKWPLFYSWAWLLTKTGPVRVWSGPYFTCNWTQIAASPRWGANVQLQPKSGLYKVVLIGPIPEFIFRARPLPQYPGLSILKTDGGGSAFEKLNFWIFFIHKYPMIWRRYQTSKIKILWYFQIKIIEYMVAKRALVIWIQTLLKYGGLNACPNLGPISSISV